MLLEYDIKVAEAKIKVEQSIRDIDIKLAKTLKYFKNLIITLQNSEEKKEHKNCVWICEMRYLSAAYTLAELQQNFGNCVKLIWEDAIRLENMRISCVKKSMEEYMKIQSTIFMHDTIKAIETLSSIEENNTDSLQSHRLFKTEEFKIMEEIGIREEYINQLACWVPEKISNFDWILKEGNIFMENGVFQQWQECYGVIVKSRLLHIFNDKPVFPFAEPLESLYLPKAKLMVSQSPEFYVEITENTQTGFFKKLVTGKQLTIRTKNSEELTEWMELIQSLK